MKRQVVPSKITLVGTGIRRVAIADDHALVRHGTRLVLEGSGRYEVTAEAACPEQVLALMDQVDYDVLIMDLNMPAPAADGIPLLRTLRVLRPELPIIVFTAATHGPLVHHLLNSGANACVAKRDGVHELLAALDAVLHQRRHLSDTLRRSVKVHVQTSAPALSVREVDVLRQLASGLSVSQIAQRLHRTVATISAHKHEAMRKLRLPHDLALHDHLRTAGFSR